MMAEVAGKRLGMVCVQCAGGMTWLVLKVNYIKRTG